MFKFIATIVVLLAALGGAWYMGWITKFVPSVPLPAEFFAPQEPIAATTTPSTAGQPTAQNDLPTSPTDASDQALTQDAAAIDMQMGAFAGYSTAAQNSLNDKPVTQEY